MPPVDAGSISSEVRIKLSALNADIVACKTAFDNLGTEWTTLADKYSKGGGAAYKKALQDIAKETKNVEGAAKAGALSESQAVQRLIELRQRELRVLQDKAVKEGTVSAETVAAIHKTEQALGDLQAKQQLLEGKGGSGGGMVAMWGKMRDAMLGPVAIAKEVIGALQAIKAKADEMENAWAAQAEATALVENTLKMTGATAWTTSEHLHELASSLQDTTKYGDETILSMQSVLLGFRNIQGANFDKATEAVLDMATVMKMDLTAAAQAVGKALDNPALGLDSLSKQGFKFTQQEKDMMQAMQDAGDIAGAQAIIMKELEKTFGGASKAVGDLDISLRDKLKNAVGDVNEEIGRSISRTLAPWREKWIEVNKEIATNIKAHNDLAEAVAADEKTEAQYQVLINETTKKLASRKKTLEQYLGAEWQTRISKNVENELALLEAEIQGYQWQIESIQRLNKARADEAKKREEQIAKEEAEAAKKLESAEWQKKLEAERVKITKTYADELTRISREETAGALTAAEAEKARLSAVESQYKALDNLITSMGVGAGVTTQMRDAALAMVIALRAEIEATADTEAAVKALQKAEADAAKDKMNKLIKSTVDAQKAYDATTKSVDSATESYRKQASEIERSTLTNAEKIASDKEAALAQAEAWEKQGQNVDELRAAIEKYYSTLESSEAKKALDKDKASWQDYARAVTEVINSIAEASVSMYGRELDELEARYERERELIENNGRTKQQALEDELAAAIAAGDADAEAEARRALELFNLEQKYTREKAQLEYKAELATWQAKGWAIAASVAEAIAEALPNLVMVGIVAASGIAQTAAWSASKPQPPALVTGGIVMPSGNDGQLVAAGDGGGADIFFGTSAMGQPLMQAFAAEVAAVVVRSMQGSQAPGQPIVVQLVLDGRVIAESTVRQINDGAVRLR